MLQQRRPAGGARPVARAAGRVRSQRFRVTSAHRSESVIRKGAPGASARGRSQTLGDARYERREGIRGRPIAAGRLTQKLPSPALKEAERSGSYNPGDLNTLTGGTIRNGTVQGHIARRATRAAPCESRPVRIRAGEARHIRLCWGREVCTKSGTSRLDPTDHRNRTKEPGTSWP